MPKINILPMFDANAPAQPEALKQRMALAKQLMSGDTGPIYSKVAGIAKVAEKAFGGFLAGQAEREHQEGVKNSGSLAAQFFGAGDDAAGSASSTPTSSDAAAPSFAGGGSARTMSMPLAGDENERAKTVFDGLVQRGLSPVAAAGIAGNFHGESGFNPGIAGDHGTSFGLAQWRGDRLDALKQLAASQGKDWRDTNVQLDHVMNELNGPEAKAYAALQGAKSPEEAATLFMQHYERPAAWAMKQSGPGRASMAAQIFSRFGNAAPTNMADLPAPGASPAAIDSQAQGFAIPGGPAVAETEEDVQRLEQGMPMAQAAPAAPMAPETTGSLPTAAPQPRARTNTKDPHKMALAKALSTGGGPALPPDLLDNLSPTQVMEMQGPNREAIIGQLLQSRPDTAQAGGVNPQLLAKALMSYGPDAQPASAGTNAPGPNAALARALNPALQAGGTTPRENSLQLASAGVPVNSQNNDAAAAMDTAPSTTGALPAPWNASGPAITPMPASAGPNASPAPAAPGGISAERRALGMRILQDPYADATVKAAVLKELGPANYSYQTTQDGTVLRFDPRGGAPVPVYHAQKRDDVEYGVIGKDAYGNEQYGWKNKTKQQVTPSSVAQQAAPLGPDGRPLPPEVDPKTVREAASKRFAENSLPASFEDEQKLRKEIQDLPSYKNLSQAVPIYRSMVDAAGRNSKASDLNLVYGLGKIMDPGSVVREGEMVMVKNTGSLPDWLVGAINSLNGGAALTPETRKAVMAEAYSRLQSYNDTFAFDRDNYRGIATRGRMNVDNILPSFGEFKPWEPPVPATPNPSAVDPLAAAREAIAKGADRAKVIERLKANGINPEGL